MNTEVERSTAAGRGARRTLAQGVLVFRWLWLLWMVISAINRSSELEMAVLAWITIAAAALWTGWLSIHPDDGRPGVLAVDISLSVCAVLVSGLVAPDERVVSVPFFATGYPLSTPLLWGAMRGAAGGLVAGVVLGLAHLLSRPINGIAIGELTSDQLQSMIGAMANYVVAGVAVGFVSTLLVRSETRLASATDALVEERERAARLAERESLARQIHDSVLQALALVHKRGRELAGQRTIPPEEVEALAGVAKQQEVELRALILREPEDAPTGRAPLRDALERVGRSVDGILVTVSAVGPIWLERHAVEELAAAVRQALENVVRHARATKATVFAEQNGTEVVVSVRDDGAGFDYDEALLSERGKVGILKSMKGRVVDLGGRMQITSAPGRGTEVEFVVPAAGNR